MPPFFGLRNPDAVEPTLLHCQAVWHAIELAVGIHRDIPAPLLDHSISTCLHVSLLRNEGSSQQFCIRGVGESLEVAPLPALVEFAKLALEDSRFMPLEPWELPNIYVQVIFRSGFEPLDSLSSLDENFGVVFSKGDLIAVLDPSDASGPFVSDTRSFAQLVTDHNLKGPFVKFRSYQMLMSYEEYCTLITNISVKMEPA